MSTSQSCGATNPQSPAAFEQAGLMDALKKQYAKPSEWEQHRAIIKKLYLDEDRTLKDVKTYMETEHGFIATLAMYKKRVRAWHLDKNLNENDVLMLLQQSRNSELVVRGRSLTGPKLWRYLQRKPGLLAELRKKDPAFGQLSKRVPNAILTLRISPAAIGVLGLAHAPTVSTTPDTTACSPALKGCLTAVSSYYRDNLLPSVSNPNGDWRRVVLGKGSLADKHSVIAAIAPLVRFHDTFAFVADRLNSTMDNHAETLLLLQPQFDELKGILTDQNPEFIFCMLQLVRSLRRRQRPELVRLLHGYILELSTIMLGGHHPISTDLAAPSDLPENDLDETIDAILLQAEKELASCGGSSNTSSIASAATSPVEIAPKREQNEQLEGEAPVAKMRDQVESWLHKHHQLSGPTTLGEAPSTPAAATHILKGRLSEGRPMHQAAGAGRDTFPRAAAAAAAAQAPTWV